ncbi:aminotransferase class V-fold PLP-dependent enzyme [Scatolibacter rhodanostii]|uniref:aminotransferase class V-fold PLP-dependent enzyme n=1 Tax=Scatolibacter rhodanostii TaxID=2014781 RepID=UPI000C084AB2|nr:aminotransferase class V-fold PLP-dependent enzyme [Scatolibacter rhodanostii]
MIYLDNSATTFPKPIQVINRMNLALKQFAANPGRSGYEMSMRTAEEVYACRRDAAQFFGAEGAECVLFQPSCTQAVNIVIKGLLKPGDHVVVSDLEHNAVMRPLEKMTKVGISYTAAKTYESKPQKTVESFREAIRPETKLVICTYASNVFGIRLPILEIAKVAHEKGVQICVDCAQAAGVVPIHMRKDQLDYLCIAGHKGLYGPMGTGMLIMSSEQQLDTLVEGGTGTSSRELIQPDEFPERFESGTQNIPGIAGLRAGMDFVQKTGIDNIYQKEMKHIAQLYQSLEKIPKVILYTSKPQAPFFVPVLSFNIEGMASEEVGAYLARHDICVRCGLHCAPAAHEKMNTLDGTVRISPSYFTKEHEIQVFLRAIMKIVQ